MKGRRAGAEAAAHSPSHAPSSPTPDSTLYKDIIYLRIYLFIHLFIYLFIYKYYYLLPSCALWGRARGVLAVLAGSLLLPPWLLLSLSYSFYKLQVWGLCANSSCELSAHQTHMHSSDPSVRTLSPLGWYPPPSSRAPGLFCSFLYPQTVAPSPACLLSLSSPLP